MRAAFATLATVCVLTQAGRARSEPPLLRATPVVDTVTSEVGEVDVSFSGPPGAAVIELDRVDVGTSVRERSLAVDVGAEPGHVTLPLRSGVDYRVRLSRDGRALAIAPAFVKRERGPSIWARDIGLPTLACSTCTGPSCCPAPTYGFVRGAWPESSLSYERVVLFGMSPAAFSTLTPAACRPLVDWVRSGGVLFVAGAGALPVELPCGLGRASELDRRDATISLGQGRVVRVAPASESPAIGGDAMSALYIDALGRTLPPRRFAGYERFLERPPGGFFAAASSAAFALALLMGPALFLILRRRGRAEQALLLIPVASVLGLGGVLAIARAAAPTPHEKRVVSVEVASGERRGRTSIVHGFVAPDGPVRVRPLLPGASISADESVSPGFWSAPIRRADDGTLLLESDEPRRLRDFLAFEETAFAEGADPVTLTCTHAACTVTNATGAPLLSAWVTRQGERVYVGRIDRMATATFRTRMTKALEEDTSDAALSDFVGDDWSTTVARPVTLYALRAEGGATEALRVTCAHPCEAP